MIWDLTWQFPLLVDENGYLLAKDNGDGVIVGFDGTQTKEAFIAEAESFWQDLIDEMDN